MTVVRSPQAVDDVFAIWLYIRQHDESAADRLIDRIDGKLAVLEAYPQMGSVRGELGEQVRSVTIGRYVILYRPIEGVEVIRVLHGARDLSQVGFD